MRFLVIFCLYCVVYSESAKNLPTFYRPDEENKHVRGQNYEYSPMRQDLVACSVHNGQFLCKDKRKCIDLLHTCNDKCDCYDCSDESDMCWEYNDDLCRTCDYLCLPSPHGSLCLCNNYTSSEISVLCEQLQECDPYNHCDQKCVLYEGRERCSCRENYRGKPNTKGQKCISDVSYENLLLYSTNNEIKLFNFTANGAFVIRKDVECKGLAAAGDYFYYGTADKNTGYVHKTSMVTGETDLTIETYSPIIFSIDVDWITGNIYFSTDQSLGVCSKEEEFCAELKSLIVSDSCHLSVAPHSGFLFYSLGPIQHWYQHSRIMKASMDGSNERILYMRNLRRPIALTVDELSEKVYWMDSDLGEIQSIQFDGKNWRTLFVGSQVHIFTINKFEGNLFWSEESKNTIGLNFETNTNMKLIHDKNATSIKYLYAFNPVLQRNRISNPCKNSGCKGLCLLRPSSSKGLIDFTCMCDNMTSSSRKHWCNNPSAHVKWRFETDFEYEIRSPQSEGRFKWLKVISLVIIFSFLIVLAIFSIYFIFRRRVLHRYFDRVMNWNRNGDAEEQMPLTEYMDSEL
ncbi:vitellogenin receptor-like isoform X2 [Planococcus citri]|uniref:vitellogenin receptor-like isoform X2 n=1 Tax=Planococcus citri TaxID=170843 RepID=UPI0031F7423B